MDFSGAFQGVLWINIVVVFLLKQSCPRPRLCLLFFGPPGDGSGGVLLCPNLPGQLIEQVGGVGVSDPRFGVLKHGYQV